MKVNIDGQMYEWDNDAMTLAEAFELKELTGWGLRSFYQAYAIDGDPDAYAWIAYCSRKRAGEKPEFKTAVSDLALLVNSIDEASTEAAKAESPDPTEPETDSG